MHTINQTTRSAVPIDLVFTMSEITECPLVPPLFPNLSLLQQNVLVFVIFGLIASGTWLLLQLYDYMRTKSNKYWTSWVKLWPSLGVFPYLIVGITHFGDMAKDNVCIVPPNGTWGWWWLPMSRERTVAVTGYGEIVAGLLLAVSGVLKTTRLRQWTSTFLFLMTVGMTFANIYMVTHVSWIMETDQPASLAFHVARTLVQCIWLSNLLYMAKDQERHQPSDKVSKEMKSK